MMASVVAAGNQRTSLKLSGVDPETCMIVFKNHWAQVVKILEKHEPRGSSSGALSFLSAASRLGPIPADEASAVQNYVEHMLFLLMEEEAGRGGAMGPILEFVVVEGVMERLFLWSLRRQFTEGMKLEQLRMYQMLLSQARQPLLHHKPVLRPLMTLLASCADSGTGTGAEGASVVEAELVLLLNQLCVALVKDPSVLELFFHTSEDQGAANFLLFSLLIPYTHRQGSVGQQARDALLVIMSLSASEARVAQHIAENTYFCPVLATGLSGLYSSLPARLQVYSEDWHCLEQADWQQVPALVHFLHSLDFCSAVTKVAHPSIRTQLLGYIYNGFLVPVLAPALHKPTVEEVMTTTAYLDLFLRSVSEPALLQTFLSFILLHTHDNVHVLDTLVSRVNTPFQLGTVSLALFRTLIGLFCEDVMLQLVFRYLMPCSHLSRRQRSSLTHRDCCASGAASFLFLMPSWCLVLHLQTSTHTEHIHWPKAVDESISESVGYCRGSDFLMDVNYLLYLLDARLAISISHSACRLWSAPYDGINPAPREYQFQTPGGVGGGKEHIEEERTHRVKSESMRSTTPPLSALSPSPSDAISTGNRVELEWDDIFADECPSSAKAANEVNPPPLPPQHIQEMCRSATRLVHGSYAEESDFQDDVLVYDLVAQRDTNMAVSAVNPQALDSVSSGRKASAATLTAVTGRTIMETVSSIMSTRRSDDGDQEERKRRKAVRITEGEDENKDGQGELNGYLSFNGLNAENYRDKDDDYVDEVTAFKQNSHHTHTHQQNTQHLTHTSPNGISEFSSHSTSISETDISSLPGNKITDGNDFLSHYRELMLSLGAEPDCDKIDDSRTFRKRVCALRRRLAEEEEEELLWKGGDLNSSRDEGKEEEEEEKEGEQRGSSRKHGVPFTGPFISVLLSRLENLLENSIAVNLLVTGILAQLASYPQPLLRSFLLSTSTQSQPNIRTLYQVLVTLRAQIERYVSDKTDYPALVAQAWRYLLAKDQDSKIREHLQSQGGDITAHPNGSVKNTVCPPPLSALPLCPPVPTQARSRVFAIILYAEFLKELAAISQEHSAAPDCTAEE
ncbi:FHF complex subunit HOOK-interacting protein 1A-like [Genypterus blacodes]|uniref:FHF complex subunit HOOK-interacting protein 1A-like n=1 Tax=Genypterus blacodes TaxID=154954 RepID=UPI003F75FD07